MPKVLRGEPQEPGAHGTPLATGGSDEHCGVPGAFLLEVGISSSYYIARFWGLTGNPRPAPAERSKPAWILPSLPLNERHGAPATLTIAREPVADTPEPIGPLHPRSMDVHTVITKVLKAAGLWKLP